MKTSIYSPHYTELRKWLRAKREEKGLSLRAVGERLGRHHSILGKLEQQERRKIELIEFVEYCHALKIDPKEGLEIIIQSIASSPAAQIQMKNLK